MKYTKKDAKKYIVNTFNNARTLHKNDTNCYAMGTLYEYESFDTEEEAFTAFNGNYKKCKNCFKGE